MCVARVVAKAVAKVFPYVVHFHISAHFPTYPLILKRTFAFFCNLRPLNVMKRA